MLGPVQILGRFKSTKQKFESGVIRREQSMQALTFVFAFVAVLALIGVAAWLVRRFAGNRLGANTNRGRMPRLAVIDAAAVDGRRRLVLVRRDNIEHLLMIGGIRCRNGLPWVAPSRSLPGLCRCPMCPAGPIAIARKPNRKCPNRRRGRCGRLLPTNCAVL